MKYLIVVEKTKNGFSAYSPDVEGCVATGKTQQEVERRMKTALNFHLDGLKEEGYPHPVARSYSQFMEVMA